MANELKKILKSYKTVYDTSLNTKIMNKEDDRPLKDFVIDIMETLEVLPYIKFKGYEYTDRQSEIDINKYVSKRDKGKTKKEKFDYKFINDTRFGLLKCHLEISLPEKDKETGAPFIHTYPITKNIMIPYQDEKGYYHIGGKRQYLIYQLVEKSTYTNGAKVPLKSTMPVPMLRVKYTTEDIFGNAYKLPLYKLEIFNKEVNVILLYLAYGYDRGMDYLGMTNVIDFIPDIPKEPDEDHLYFQLSTKCYLTVIKSLFEKYPYIQSVVAGFMDTSTNRTTIASLKNRRNWIKMISDRGSFDHGYNTLKYVNRYLDITTKKMLKVHPINKTDTYAVLRWMMQHFNDLRKKDNMDFGNKRIRANEYVASLLSFDINKKINRVIKHGDNINITHLREIFKFKSDIIMQKLNSSGILRFDDNVNDMTMWSKFKYTTKGPHAAGNKNSNNVSVAMRDLNPSMLGYVDCLVCGNADPGTSGLLSPFSDMKSFYFDDSNESEDFIYNLHKDLSEYADTHHIQQIQMKFDNPTDYYNMLKKLSDYSRDNVRISATSITGNYDIVLEEEEDIDVKAEKEEDTKETEKKKRGRKKKSE